MCCGLLPISGYLCTGLVNGLEFEMIYKKFTIEIGKCLDVNYIEFCKMVDKFAQNIWDDPTGKVAQQRSCHVSEVKRSSLSIHRCGCCEQYSTIQLYINVS